MKSSWVIDGVLACAVAGLAGAPMLIKNWLLVGCPLAPQFGCQDTFWTSAYEIAHTHRQNISVVDLLFYPVVWTFASREDMLGNISPLFLGFLPFLLAYRWSPIARPAVMAGLAGLASMAVWWLVKPLILYTRWLLVPLGLLTVPLSASVVAVERDRHHGRTAKWLVGGAILTLSAFLLFQSRGVVYGLRYVVALDSRSARYESKPGYEVGAWLEAHVRRGQRIALGGWSGYPYFVSPPHLRDSESAEELQWLWARYGSVSPAWTSGLWRFYAGNGFVYVAVKKELLESAVGAWPDDMAGGRPQVVFVGRRDAVLRIERQGG